MAWRYGKSDSFPGPCANTQVASINYRAVRYSRLREEDTITTWGNAADRSYRKMDKLEASRPIHDARSNLWEWVRQEAEAKINGVYDKQAPNWKTEAPIVVSQINKRPELEKRQLAEIWQPTAFNEVTRINAMTRYGYSQPIIDFAWTHAYRRSLHNLATDNLDIDTEEWLPAFRGIKRSLGRARRFKWGKAFQAVDDRFKGYLDS